VLSMLANVADSTNFLVLSVSTPSCFCFFTASSLQNLTNSSWMFLLD
jgi:hypothetical protein